jgi:hypothetical protein
MTTPLSRYNTAPTPQRTLALLALCAAASHAAAGVFFFFDPTRHQPAGSDAYWQLLATQPWGRLAFLGAFAFTGVFALGLIEPLRRSAHDGSALGRWLATLAMLGQAVNAIGYFRLLAGEGRRAAAYATGDAATQAAIRSFSLVLDPQGWLTFGAVGAFVLWASVAAWRGGGWPKPAALLGSAVALAYVAAWLGLLLNVPALIEAAAGAGAVVLAPIWWVLLARFWWRGRPSAGGMGRA